MLRLLWHLFAAILGIVPRLLCWLLGIQIPQANRGTGGGAVGASGGGAAAATTSRSGAPLSPQALYLRKKVGSGVRRIVVVLSRIVLREETPEELEQSATVVQEAADIVKAMSEFAEVYLITQCMSDRAEQRVREALQAAGIEHAASTTQLGLCRLLFCETTMGAASMTRQIEPQLLIDTSKQRVEQLFKYIPRVLYAGCEEISFSTQIEKIAGLEELQVEPARDEAASG